MGGDINVTLEISDGVITVSDISPNNETQGLGGYEAIEDGTYASQIEASQSADIDGVSGATITSTAIKNAVSDALAQATGEESTDGAGADEEEYTPYVPSFLMPPDPVSEGQIAETVDTEALIVGAGITGIAAARAASEAGAKVIVLEKCATYGVRSSKYGPLNSSVQKELGQPELDPAVVVNELQKFMG